MALVLRSTDDLKIDIARSINTVFKLSSQIYPTNIIINVINALTWFFYDRMNMCRHSTVRIYSWFNRIKLVFTI